MPAAEAKKEYDDDYYYLMMMLREIRQTLLVAMSLTER